MNERIVEAQRVLGALLGFLCLCHGSALAQYAGGTGTADDPYLINTADQMNAIGLHPDHWSLHFELMADIDLSAFTGESFNLIGTSEVPFEGVFDGNGHRISNFTYYVHSVPDPNIPEDFDPGDLSALFELLKNLKPTEDTGLFRKVSGPDAAIKDLCLVNPDIRIDPNSPVQHLSTAGSLIGYLGSGSKVNHCTVQGGRVCGVSQIGGLVGSSSGDITYCDATCDVAGYEQKSGGYIHLRGLYLGGLVGKAWGGSISQCSVHSNISGQSQTGGLVGSCEEQVSTSHCHVAGHVSGTQVAAGGLIGENKGAINNCHSSASVSLTKRSGEGACGGLVGSNTGPISDCNASGPVSLKTSRGGGLVGENGGVITRCRALGSVSGVSSCGGLVGANGGTIQTSYAHGDVSGADRLGGFIGHNVQGSITDCYAQGSVSGPNDIGGLIGRLETGSLSRCYASGEVQGQQAKGGLIGSVSDSAYVLPIEQCFWDTEASGTVQSAGGVGLGADQVFDRDTYVSAAWDFVGETANGFQDLWYLRSDEQMYPVLAYDVEPEPIAVYDLTEDPGWIMEGPWQFGQPLGLGAWENGHPDPNSGFTGPNVLGVNLQGDYAVSDKGPHYLTTAPIDGSAYSHMHVQFARWLNSDEADYTRVFVEVSTDSIIWQPVWEYEDTSAAVTDDAWQIVNYPLGSTANQQPQIFVRWGYHILDDESWTFSGWNIDDVQVVGLK